MSVAEFPQTKSGPAGTGPQLPAERIDQIRQRLRKHLDDTEDLSQAKVAKKIGYSGATLAYWLSGSYTGDNRAVALSVEQYLDLQEQRRSIGAGPQFVKTSIAKRIEYALQLAETTNRIAIVSTGSGLGKTRAIYAYRERHPRAVYVSCSPDMSTKAALLTELVLTLLKDEKRRTPAHARRDIVAALAGSGRPIIIDESHYLTQECVDQLRCIHDQAEVPLILSGNESTYEGKFARGSAHAPVGPTAYTQFASRVVARVQLSADDIRPNDIRLLAVQMVPEAVVTETLDRLHYEAREAGGFRRVVTILQLAQMFAATKTVAKAHVLRAIEELRSVGGDE